MGYGMAVNLRTKMDPEMTLLICDVNTAALDKFQKQMEGKGPIAVVQNGAEAARKAVRLSPRMLSSTHGGVADFVPQDIIITMLPGPNEVKDVYLNSSTSVMAGTKGTTNKLLMECGTIDSDVVIEVGNAFQKSGTGLFADAPVSGGPGGAKSGTLAFMVGSDPEIFPRVKAVLLHMGKADGIFLCGPVGSGEAFKVLNNYLSAIISVATSETLNIAIKSGYDPAKLTDVIQASGGQCWILDHCNPVPGIKPNVSSSRGYEDGFRVELCTKVFKMGVKMAKEAGAKTILSEATERGFESVCEDERYKGKDARVIYKWLADEPVE
jgi:3-hydroxyisobutyrate/3-hydroxypropionate dehydrogenase